MAVNSESPEMEHSLIKQRGYSSPNGNLAVAAKLRDPANVSILPDAELFLLPAQAGAPPSLLMSHRS